jgi:hypothetical protein
MRRGEGSTPAVLYGEVAIAIAVAVAAGRRTGGAGRRGAAYIGAWTQDLYTPIAKQHREVAASRLAPDHKI